MIFFHQRFHLLSCFFDRERQRKRREREERERENEGEEQKTKMWTSVFVKRHQDKFVCLILFLLTMLLFMRGSGTTTRRREKSSFEAEAARWSNIVTDLTSKLEDLERNSGISSTKRDDVKDVKIYVYDLSESVQRGNLKGASLLWSERGYYMGNKVCDRSVHSSTTSQESISNDKSRRLICSTFQCITLATCTPELPSSPRLINSYVSHMTTFKRNFRSGTARWEIMSGHLRMIWWMCCTARGTSTFDMDHHNG